MSQGRLIAGSFLTGSVFLGVGFYLGLATIWVPGVALMIIAVVWIAIHLWPKDVEVER